MTTATIERMELCEIVQSRFINESRDRVDREGGVIRGVKILGLKSSNGRRYTPEALKSAVPFYEGRGVNIDHREAEDQATDRSVRDHFGELRNVVVIEGKGLFGDLYFLKTHEEAEPICERAERMPNQLGLSHDAEGSVHREGDEIVVDSIDGVTSVDLVRYPATTQGLFESEKESIDMTTRTKTAKKPLKEQTVQKVADDAPKEKIVQEQDVVAAPPPSEAPSFIEQVKAIIGNPDATDDQMKEQIGALVKPVEEPMAEQEGGEEKKPDEVTEQESSGEDDKETMESVRKLQRRLDAQDVLMESNVDRSQVPPAQMAALMNSPNREVMVSLVESWPGYTKRQNLAGPSVVPHAGPRPSSSYDQLREELVGDNS